MQTKIKVRVQAKGGKYLGPALAATPPLLTVTVDGQQQIRNLQFPTCGSGVVSSRPEPSASPHHIVVSKPSLPSKYTPGTYYLLPTTDPATDPALVVTLDLPAGTTPVEFSATAYAPQEVTASVTVPLVGGQDRTADPGIVVLVPGLRITNVAVLPVNAQVTVVTASVAMMCGCAITPEFVQTLPAEPYWPAYEFEVTARLGSSPAVRMACTGTSLFQAAVPVRYSGQSVVVRADQPGVPGNRNEVTST